MISVYSYNRAESILSQPSIEDLPWHLESEHVDLWVDLETPTPEESEILRTIFDFHELAIEDCITIDTEEAKIDDYEDYLFIVLHSIFFNTEQLVFDIIEVDFFLGKNYVVTFHKKSAIGIMQLKKRLENATDFMALGTDEILHAIVDSLVDNYFIQFKSLEKAIYKLEAEILSNPTKETISNLFKLKIGMINLRRILTPGEEVMQSLGETEHELIQEENRVYFQDVHDHISSIEGLLRSYMEMANSTMDNYVSITTHRMNSVIQFFTTMAFLILIPTLFVSIFSMNVPLPFQKSPFSFLLIMLLNFLLTGLIYLYFKKKDWF